MGLLSTGLKAIAMGSLSIGIMKKVKDFICRGGDDDEFKAGDHIYAYRMRTAYSHHGIYVGKNRVIHFTNDGVMGKKGLLARLLGFISSSSPCMSVCSHCDCGQGIEKSGVIMTCIDCFSLGGTVHRYEYDVVASDAPPGTSTHLQSGDPDKVISHAMEKLRDGYGKYDLVRNNCEHFALYCKTGDVVAKSGQVQAIVDEFKQLVRILPYTSGSFSMKLVSLLGSKAMEFFV